YRRAGVPGPLACDGVRERPLLIPGRTCPASVRPVGASAAARPISALETKEYASAGPVGTTANPAARDAIGAMRARNAGTSSRGTRNDKDAATFVGFAAGRYRQGGSAARPLSRAARRPR